MGYRSRESTEFSLRSQRRSKVLEPDTAFSIQPRRRKAFLMYSSPVVKMNTTVSFFARSFDR